MPEYAHLLQQSWRQLRFLPTSPLAGLVPVADASVLDGLLARASVYRPQPPALRDLDRLPQLKVYLGLPGRGPASRFSDGSFRAIYGGETLDTCVAEMAFHHSRTLAETSEPAGAIRVFEALALKVSGAFPDVRKGHRDLRLAGEYRHAQAFGRGLRSAGEPGTVFRSVRRQGGECLALFLAAPVKACTLKQMVALQWDGERLG